MSTILWNVVVALGIVGLGQIVGTWLAGVARFSLARTGVDPEVRRLIAGVVQPLVLIAAIIGALPWIGVEPGSLIAVLGASTLAIGLALRSSLSNIASGAILLTLRPIREGDAVEVAGRQGVLEALEIYATTLQTPDGTLVTVPNDVVLKSAIVNFTRLGTRRADVEFHIAPDGKRVDAALTALLDVISSHDDVKTEPAPSVLVLRQAPGTVVVAARFYAAASDLNRVKAEVLTRGLQALATAKVPLATGSASV